MDIRLTTTTTQLYKNVPDFLMSREDLEEYNDEASDRHFMGSLDMATDDKPIGYWFICDEKQSIYENNLFYKDKDEFGDEFWERCEPDSSDVNFWEIETHESTNILKMATKTNTDHEQTDLYIVEFVNDLFETLRHDDMFKRLTKEGLLEYVQDYITDQKEYFGKHYKFDLDLTKQQDMDSIMHFICKYHDEYDTDDEEDEMEDEDDE